MPAQPAAERSVSRRGLLHTGVVAAGAAALLQALEAWGGEESNAKVRELEKIEPQKFAWGWIRWLMNAQVDPDAEMTLGIVQIEPHQANPLHIHPNSAEYLYMLSGSCEHRLGKEWFTVKAGEMLRIPKGVAHCARTGNEGCRALIVYNTGTRQMMPVQE